MYKALHIFSATVIASLIVVSNAAALDTGYNGTLCNPKTSADAPRISYDPGFGIFNPSTAVGNAQCGASHPFNGDVLDVSATFYDRHTTQDISCLILILNSDGGVLNSGVIHSDGFASGSMLRTFSNPFVVAAASVNLSCTIPPSSPNGVSHIASYRIRS